MSENAAQEQTRWTCSMHPQIILPSNDQKCPICFMDLIPLEEESGGGGGGSGPQRRGRGPGRCGRRPGGTPLPGAAGSPGGRVAVDDNRLREVTAWYAGRLDRLHVGTRGVAVRAGQPLAEIYSPDLYSAQVELQAAASRTDGAGRLLESARRKLRLLGLSSDRIADIEAGATPRDHVVISAEAAGVVLERKAVEGQYVKEGGVLYTVVDLGHVWLKLEAFERDLAWLRAGQQVSSASAACPVRFSRGSSSSSTRPG